MYTTSGALPVKGGQTPWMVCPLKIQAAIGRRSDAVFGQRPPSGPYSSLAVLASVSQTFDFFERRKDFGEGVSLTNSIFGGNAESFQPHFGRGASTSFHWS